MTGGISPADLTPPSSARDYARKLLDEHYGWDGVPWQPNQVLAGVDTPCCGAGVSVSVDVVEPLKSRPRVVCPACHKRYEMQVTGLLLGGDGTRSGVLVRGVFHPDVRPASTVLTQAFARRGLPAGAVGYALRKMGVPAKDVTDVFCDDLDPSTVSVMFCKESIGWCRGFSRAELEAVW